MTNKGVKYFPIKTATACKLKWAWNTLYLPNSTSGACHRTAFEPVTADNFENFHNTERKQNDRRRMLNGLWPEENCGYCKSIESAGGFSDRRLHLEIPGLIPDELNTDLTSTNIKPKLLEVYLNNTCNLKCLYCTEILSSSIDNENKKFGNFELDGVILDSNFVNKTDEIFPAFLEWFKDNYSNLERLHLLGGEPFFQKEFDIILDFLKTNTNSKCEINIITNLMVPETKFIQYIEVFRLMVKEKRIRRLDISCSIDCWGEPQEYVRFGLKLETWVKNFEYLLKQKWLKININQTISALTIKTMPDLLRKLEVWRKQRPVGHFFSLVAPGPSYLIPKIFGPGEFDKDFEEIISLMQKTDPVLNYMIGIQTEYLQSTADNNEIKKLIIFLNEKDRRRGTNWRKVFPWLEKYVVQ